MTRGVPQSEEGFRKARATARLAATLVLACAATLAGAQTYPDRPIRLIVPAGAGSSPDIHARLFGTELGKLLGTTIVVENVPGAAGILGTDRAMKAPADGYTMLYGYNQLVTMNPALYPKLPFDPKRDMAPVTRVLTGAYVWIAGTNAPMRSASDWLAKAKAQPGKLTYGTAGNGTAAHLGAALVESMTGIELLHVPYKSSPAAVADVIAGRLDTMMEPTGSAVRMVQGGRVTPLAVTTARRLSVLPDVPALAELIPGYEVLGWHAIWVPAGTPAPLIARLNEAWRKVLSLPEIRSRLSEVAFEPVGSSPEELALITEREAAMWLRVIRERKITAD